MPQFCPIWWAIYPVVVFFIVVVFSLLVFDNLEEGLGDVISDNVESGWEKFSWLW